ncbi:hypothetical protein MXB_3936 [Myxobolus squamalis]|nr:hypothetical protein MXB_3936 [Myxobolus squamalis]
MLKHHGIKLGYMSAYEILTVNTVIANNEIVYRSFIDISVAVSSPKVLNVGISCTCHTKRSPHEYN